MTGGRLADRGGSIDTSFLRDTSKLLFEADGALPFGRTDRMPTRAPATPPTAILILPHVDDHSFTLLQQEVIMEFAIIPKPATVLII